MRAAFSLLGLVIVAAIVLNLVKKEATTLARAPVVGARAASAAGVALPAQTTPEAVGAQVQGSLDEAAKRTAEAASDAGV